MSLCPLTKCCDEAAHKHKQCGNENNSVPVFQCEAQLAHRTDSLRPLNRLTGWKML